MMFRRLLFGAIVSMAPAAHAASQDPASGEWNSLRVGMWVRLCAETAPSFSGFAGVAEEAGFSLNAKGTYVYTENDLQASLLEVNESCSCLVSFKSDDHSLAKQALDEAMSGEFGDQYQSDADTTGTLKTSAGTASIEVKAMEFEGASWLGLFIAARGACP